MLMFVLMFLICSLFLSLVDSVDMSAPGPFKVGWQKMLMKPSTGLEFDSIVVYPSLTVGWQAAPDPNHGPYPVIVFGHGYSTEADSYMSTLEHLASWGYIVAAPEVPALHHARYATEMSTCFTHLEKVNTDPQSLFRGLIDHKHYGIFGHTAGAGAAIVAASKDPRIRCVVALAPVDTMPSSILTVKNVHVPVNIIAAKDDWLAAADKNSVPIYKNANPPKQFHVLAGGANAYFYDGEGVHRQRQLRISRFFLTTWFNLYLRQDVHMWPYVWGDNIWNDTVVFSVHDRGNPMDLARKKYPGDTAFVQLDEEVHTHNPLTFDPRNPSTFSKEFSKPGPHKVGNTNITTTDRDGKLFSAVIYYPSTSEGIGTPLDLDQAPYPIIVFSHGWFQVPESYSTTLQNFASHGYVIFCSRASQELFADRFAAELQSIMNWIQVESARNGSDWYQAVDPTRIALVGHSIGGGVSILAAANDPRVKAIIAYAPSQTHNPATRDILPHVHVPICVICADDEQDGDIRLHSLPLYTKANFPKIFHQFQNGSNTFFSDGLLLGTQHRKQLKITQDLSRAFLDLYLKGDSKPGQEKAWRAVWGPEAFNITKVNHFMEAGFRLTPAGKNFVHDSSTNSSVNSSSSSPLFPFEYHMNTTRGGICDFELIVNNTSPVSHIFDVFIDDNIWPVNAPTRTGRLRPRQSATFHVVVSAPKKTQRSMDRFIVSIRSDTDGFTRQALLLECSVPVEKVVIKAKSLPKASVSAKIINSTDSVSNKTKTVDLKETEKQTSNIEKQTSSIEKQKVLVVEEEQQQQKQEEKKDNDKKDKDNENVDKEDNISKRSDIDDEEDNEFVNSPNKQIFLENDDFIGQTESL
eukprot:c18262_g1_i3.p1 GENE.c18262_g1_i3~~c18262_g1_i3.p1  ORF type:complete len:861 (+),score=336.60 c18262_g1_i3:42-2624(+)